MNTATHSTRQASGATGPVALEALDELDMLEHFVEAIQLVSASCGEHGKVVDALATAVLERADATRRILWGTRP